MKLTRLAMRMAAGVVLAAGACAPLRADGRTETLNVWPGAPPGETAPVGEERDTTKPTDGLVAGKHVIRLGNVSTPTLTIYRSAKEKDTGTAVLIAPGGGYSILAMDLEGTEVAEWLNTLGVTGIVLKYRVPRRQDQKEGPPAAPLQDAQRAMSLVRSHAVQWGIDPHRIGMLGFSAGGHLTANTSTESDRRSYAALDGVDKESCRPDFTILIYPAYLTNRELTELSPEIRVSKDTPPAFIVQTGDDAVHVENAVVYYQALKRAGVPAELHVYPTGGHGYGLRRTEQQVTTWPDRLEAWLRGRGLLPNPKV